MYVLDRYRLVALLCKAYPLTGVWIVNWIQNILHELPEHSLPYHVPWPQEASLSLSFNDMVGVNDASSDGVWADSIGSASVEWWQSNTY